MTNTKSTKRALLSSVMALFLCFTMLLGTTFAYFTDSATSGVNKIVAGNLDIGVYYAYPSDVVDGDIPENAWNPLTADESVFNAEALWEPGYTEAVFFKFDNEGSLALQYQLKIDILKETLGKTKDGADIQLSNYIQTYICNNFAWNYQSFLFTERDQATDPVGAPDPFYDTLYNAANADANRADNYEENALSLDSWQWLDPTESTYATLVLWMPTTVGSEANHDGENVPSVDLGINVIATQYTYEKDSFGNDYDKDSTFPSIYLDDIDELLNNGGDVVLSTDMTFSANDTTANSGYGKTGLCVQNGATLDGNGNTISVKNAGATWDCAVNAKSGTIKNVTVNDSFRGIFMGGATGDVYIDNVVLDKVCYTFNSDGGNKAYGVYISNSTLNGWTSYSDVHKEVVFTNCTFGQGTGGYRYAFCRPYNASVFENCVFAEGFEFDTSKTSEITFINCYYGDTLITAENAATLTTFFCNGTNGVTIR